jgi:hypothetical protein
MSTTVLWRSMKANKLTAFVSSSSAIRGFLPTALCLMVPHSAVKLLSCVLGRWTNYQWSIWGAVIQ